MSDRMRIPAGLEAAAKLGQVEDFPERFRPGRHPGPGDRAARPSFRHWAYPVPRPEEESSPRGELSKPGLLTIETLSCSHHLIRGSTYTSSISHRPLVSSG